MMVFLWHYKIVVALITTKLYPQKQNVKKTSNKQNNLMNSIIQMCKRGLMHGDCDLMDYGCVTQLLFY